MRGTRAAGAGGSGPSRRGPMRETGVSAAACGFFWRGEAAVRAGGGKGGDATRRDAAAIGWSRRGAERTRSRGRRADHASERGRTDPARRGAERSPWPREAGGAAALPPFGLGVGVGFGSVSATPAHVRVPFDASSTGKGPKRAAKKGAETKPHDGTSDSARDSAPCGYSQPRASLAMPNGTTAGWWRTHQPGRLLQSRSQLPQARSRPTATATASQILVDYSDYLRSPETEFARPCVFYRHNLKQAESNC